MVFTISVTALPSRTDATVENRRDRRDDPVPSSVKSWRMVVSGGEKCAASGMSSKPTMLTATGTATP